MIYILFCWYESIWTFRLCLNLQSECLNKHYSDDFDENNETQGLIFHDVLSQLWNKPDRKSILFTVNIVEPPPDKTNKITVRPAKTQISLGIRPVWSETSLCAQWVVRTQAFFMRTAKTLIGLGGCPGWSESSLSTHTILLVLTWGGSVCFLL